MRPGFRAIEEGCDAPFEGHKAPKGRAWRRSILPTDISSPPVTASQNDEEIRERSIGFQNSSEYTGHLRLAQIPLVTPLSRSRDAPCLPEDAGDAAR